MLSIPSSIYYYFDFYSYDNFGQSYTLAIFIFCKKCFIINLNVSFKFCIFFFKKWATLWKFFYFVRSNCQFLFTWYVRFMYVNFRNNDLQLSWCEISFWFITDYNYLWIFKFSFVLTSIFLMIEAKIISSQLIQVFVKCFCSAFIPDALPDDFH